MNKEWNVEANEATRSFVLAHRLDDVRQLALRGAKERATAAGDRVDMPFALDQIQGWQTARKKLPSWAANDGIVYPPHLNMEQCSSEQTARYKAQCLKAVLTDRIATGVVAQSSDTLLVDITGGFGVDFSILSQLFSRAVYVERNERLCAVASHNFKSLGLTNVETLCGDGTDYLHAMQDRAVCESKQGCAEAISECRCHNSLTVVFVDPARRGDNGQRVYGIEDCAPDVLALKDELLRKADCVMLKLSPMLDWHAAVKAFGDNCREVHIVSVGNECKELLLLLCSDTMLQCEDLPVGPKMVCVNDDQRFEVDLSMARSEGMARLVEEDDAGVGKYLYVPNASAMKSGFFAHFTDIFPIAMLDRDTHLFVSDQVVGDFPGRRFEICATTTMNKRELRETLKGMERANVAVRNFPLSAVALRKKLRLADGGDTYIFGTTMHGKHILLITHPDITHSEI